MKSKDYYLILEVDREASYKDIRDAYRRLAMIYHPDRNSGLDAPARMLEINEAYAVLSSPEKRAAFDEMYDKYGGKARKKFRSSYSEQDIYKNTDIDKIFEELSKMFGLRSYEAVFRELLKHDKKKDKAINSHFKWNFLKKTEKANRQQTTISAAKHIKSFASRISGFLKKNAISSRIYDKNQHDTIYITPEQAMMGGKISYLSPVTGKQSIVTIPKWVKDGTEIHLKGMGLDNKKEERPDDLFLKIRVRKKPFRRLKNIFKRKNNK